jgi:hypothetical protein
LKQSAVVFAAIAERTQVDIELPPPDLEIEDWHLLVVSKPLFSLQEHSEAGSAGGWGESNDEAPPPPADAENSEDGWDIKDEVVHLEVSRNAPPVLGNPMESGWNSQSPGVHPAAGHSR